MTKTKTHQAKNPTPVEHNTLEPDAMGLERIVFFSDAVFAIAITLLVLEIRLPAGQEMITDEQLTTGLLEIWQAYLGYFISFMVIGVFWMSHHRKFRLIKRYDSTLVMLNLLFLMAIAFIPFPSSVISENPNRAGTILYALNMMVAGLWMTALWWYASHNNRLTDEHLESQVRRRELFGPIATMFVFLVSIGMAFVSPDLAKFSWWLILPASMYARKR